MLMKKLLLIMLLIGNAHAECVIQEKTVTSTSGNIEERTSIIRNISDFDNRKQCEVAYSARIGTKWYDANGKYIYSNIPNEVACARAIKSADKDLISKLNRTKTKIEQVLICNDDERYKKVNSATIGTMGRLEQFRPHPLFDGGFYYKGSVCKWFIDKEFINRDIVNLEGIICNLKDDNWAVIDKF